MGMTYEQFWDGPPLLATTYRKAYKLRLEDDNYQAWLQGLYFYGALSTALYNTFKDKGKQAESYMERPVDIFPPSKAEIKRREKAEYDKIQRQLEAMIRAQKADKKRKEAKAAKADTD